MFHIARVAIDKAAYSYDKIYDYIIPQHLTVTAGCRVVIPFGKTSERLGFVMETLTKEVEEEVAQKLKELISIVDAEPVLDRDSIVVLGWLKENTFCTWFDALRTLIPTGLGQRIDVSYCLKDSEDTQVLSCLTSRQSQLVTLLQNKNKPVPMGQITEVFPDGNLLLKVLMEKNLVEEKKQVIRKVKDQTMTMVELLPNYQDKKTTPKQQAVVDILEQGGEASVKEVCYYAGVAKGVVDKLVTNGIAQYNQMETYRDPFATADRVINGEKIQLNEEQETACQALGACYRNKNGSTALLYGVTGSGKTQVFLKHTQYVIAQGQQAIIMVPEIALTPQTIEKFHQYFGERVAVLHSGLSISQRLDEWKRIKRGLIDVVVGTRSAVFAPLPSIGLVVVDEEQEHTYKSESSPRFDARDVAKVRCKLSGGMVVLASATPSVETFYRGKIGAYTMVTLQERYGNARLPDVTIIDMKSQVGGGDGLSQQLCEELLYNLSKKEQSILLMNRRGYSTQVKCMSCHLPAQCPHCSISLKYHNANKRLMCHYCGYSAPLTNKCSSCGSEYIHFQGTGTQKIEEDLQIRFPDARILRMDMDTTMQKFSHQKHLSEFARGDYDIMVGTQMVAKGLNFPNVTLVGVIGIDQSLYSEDFRSYERVFSLITQVVGRSGRSEKLGRAYIQTYTPENPIILSAASQQYDHFFHEEIATRKLMLYPPFCRIYCVGIIGENEGKTKTATEKIHENICRLLKEEYADIPVRLLGISQGSVYRVAGKYRYKILLKVKNNKRSRDFFHQILSEGLKLSGREVSVFINPNYDNGL